MRAKAIRLSHSAQKYKKRRRRTLFRGCGGVVLGSGDDRLSRSRTIMGPAGLTAVFGMGTGGAPPVWSPESGRGTIKSAGRGSESGVGTVERGDRCVREAQAEYPSHATWAVADGGRGDDARPGMGRGRSRPARAAGGGDGSGWSSRSAVRTGRLRRSPAVHSRPIDLVVFQEPSWHLANGNLVSEGASRLDAFSAYPVPTWLPGDAPSGTAGTPEVGPPQSSRTRGDAPQVSHAHGR
jgi:hypothetical protein